MNDTSIAVGADEWTGRTGNSWAAQWRRTDRSFAMLTERLLQRIGQHAFDAALDIGCGAGELSLAMARLHPHSRVVGVDISPQLLDVARQRAGTHHSGLTFELADAATWRPAVTFAPELIVSRHGVMFFADPVSAFATWARSRLRGPPSCSPAFAPGRRTPRSPTSPDSCQRRRRLRPAMLPDRLPSAIVPGSIASLPKPDGLTLPSSLTILRWSSVRVPTLSRILPTTSPASDLPRAPCARWTSPHVSSSLPPCASSPTATCERASSRFELARGLSAHADRSALFAPSPDTPAASGLIRLFRLSRRPNSQVP